MISRHGALALMVAATLGSITVASTSHAQSYVHPTGAGSDVLGWTFVGVGLPFLVLGAIVAFGSSGATVTEGDGTRIAAARIQVADDVWLTPSGLAF